MASSSEVMLEEMRHAYDTAYLSVAKYESKTIAAFGAEIAMLLFYIDKDEIEYIRALFVVCNNGCWNVFAVLAGVAFLTATTMFIVTLTIDRHWLIPPNPDRLLYKNQYLDLAPDELEKELIMEYDEAIRRCSRKIHAMKILSDIGIYFLAGGALCLLFIKFFGV